MAFKQRYLHFYCLNELLHVAFIVGCFFLTETLDATTSTAAADNNGAGAAAASPSSFAFTFPFLEQSLLVPPPPQWATQLFSSVLPSATEAKVAWTPYLLRLLTRVAIVVVAYILFNILNFVGMAILVLFRRQFRKSAKLVRSVSREENIHPLPNFDVSEHTTHDGVRLVVLCSEKKAQRGDTKNVKKKKIALLGLPLGQKGERVFDPIFAHFGTEDWIYVTWHYRGFFSSDSPSTERRMSITHHAMDAKEVLVDCCGYATADVMIGHSMGTAVAFETVLLYPNIVKSLVVMNGFHGHVFSTAFQPFARLPFSQDCVSALVEFLLSHPNILDQVRKIGIPILNFWMPLWARFFGSPLMLKVHGEGYFLNMLSNYFGTVFTSLRNTHAWLRMFQELDAHSVYHLLPTIKQRVLIISGLMDTITPPLQSVEIARRIPHSVHYCDVFSTHATIMESPDWTVAEIHVFLEQDLLEEEEGVAGKERTSVKGVKGRQSSTVSSSPRGNSTRRSSSSNRK